jgi:hypothetical protein
MSSGSKKEPRYLYMSETRPHIHTKCGQRFPPQISKSRFSKYFFTAKLLKKMILFEGVPSGFLGLIFGFILRNKTNHF